MVLYSGSPQGQYGEIPRIHIGQSTAGAKSNVGRVNQNTIALESMGYKCHIEYQTDPCSPGHCRELFLNTQSTTGGRFLAVFGIKAIGPIKIQQLSAL